MSKATPENKSRYFESWVMPDSDPDFSTIPLFYLKPQSYRYVLHSTPLLARWLFTFQFWVVESYTYIVVGRIIAICGITSMSRRPRGQYVSCALSIQALKAILKQIQISCSYSSLVINFWPNKGHTTSMQQQGSNFQIWSKRNPDDDLMLEKCIYYGIQLAHFYNSQNCGRFFCKIDG